MLFRPYNKRMWDSTVIERNGETHIFYLCEGNLGHASTYDFITYVNHPQINGFGKSGRWNEQGLPLTGCIALVGGIYKMLAGALDPLTHRQHYGLYESTDLINWTEYEENPVLVSDGKIYAKETLERDWMYTAWRDPNVYKIEGAWYYLCMCARGHESNGNTTGSLIGNLRTKDFKTFEYLQPLDDLGRFVKYAECPDVFSLNGNTFATFLDHGWGGLRIHTQKRADSLGTYYRKLNKQSGNFEWDKEKLLIGNANARQGAWAARTYTLGNERLLFYFITAAKPSFSFPKKLDVNDSGDLCVKYFDKMDNLTGEKLEPKLKEFEQDSGIWSQEKNTFISQCAVTGTAAEILDYSKDLRVDADICANCARAGLTFRFMLRDNLFQGISVFLDYELKRIVLEKLCYRTGDGFGYADGDVVNGGTIRDIDYCNVNISKNTTYPVKIFIKDEFIEVFLNDELVITKSFDTNFTDGSLCLFTERGNSQFCVQANKLKDIIIK